MAKARPRTTPRREAKAQFLPNLAIEKLLLDPENPRLPEDVRHGEGDPQRRLLDYFLEYGVLRELALSFVDNGYFNTEPLIATADGAPKGKFCVLEGNRRLAALQILLDGTPEDRKRLDVELPPARADELREVPVMFVDSRRDATAMIGFRHIGGLKLWDSDAKARWVVAHVDAAAVVPGSSEPFEHVGRQVGEGATAIRKQYLSWSILASLRTATKYDPAKLLSEQRFGVWLRALDSPEIRAHIGLRNPRGYTEVKAAVARATEGDEAERTAAVLADLVSAADGAPPVAGDSRNITRYAAVLTNDEARQYLRAHRDLDEAYLIVAPIKLSAQIDKLTKQLRRIRDRIEANPEMLVEVTSNLAELSRVASSLNTMIKEQSS